MGYDFGRALLIGPNYKAIALKIWLRALWMICPRRFSRIFDIGPQKNFRASPNLDIASWGLPIGVCTGVFSGGSLILERLHRVSRIKIPGSFSFLIGYSNHRVRGWGVGDFSNHLSDLSFFKSLKVPAPGGSQEISQIHNLVISCFYFRGLHHF